MRKLFPQEHENTCAVAAIRTALALQYGHNIPERVLEGFGTFAHRPIREAGTWASQMRRIVKEADRAFNTGAPWRMRFRTRGTLRDLARERRNGLYPICSVRAENGSDDEHTVLVLRLGERRLTIFDPSDDHAGWRTRAAFDQWWTVDSGDRWYAVITGGGDEAQGTRVSA